MGQAEASPILIMSTRKSTKLLGFYNPKDSVFVCKSDAPYLDVTRQPLHQPLSLFSQLIDQYTGAGDWILDGTGGIGKSMIVVTRVLSIRANM